MIKLAQERAALIQGYSIIKQSFDITPRNTSPHDDKDERRDCSDITLNELSKNGFSIG